MQYSRRINFLCSNNCYTPVDTDVIRLYGYSFNTFFMKIGVMGARGSFSEMAGETYVAKHAFSDAEIEPLISAENVLSAVEDGSIDVGKSFHHCAMGVALCEYVVETMAKKGFPKEGRSSNAKIDLHQERDGIVILRVCQAWRSMRTMLIERTKAIPYR